MKTLILAALVSTPALAASPISLADLQQAVVQEQGTFSGSDCTVNVRALGGGLSISAENEGQRAELLVKNTDAITLTTDSLPGSSFVRNYAVEGAGSFRVLYADDSYASFELTSGGRTVKCETDF